MAEEHFKNPKIREAMKMLVDYNGADQLGA
jgi:hypothetical protein